MIKYQKEFAIILFPWIRTNPWIIRSIIFKQCIEPNNKLTTWGFDDERGSTYIRLLPPKSVTKNYYFGFVPPPKNITKLSHSWTSNQRTRICVIQQITSLLLSTRFTMGHFSIKILNCVESLYLLQESRAINFILIDHLFA